MTALATTPKATAGLTQTARALRPLLAVLRPHLRLLSAALVCSVLAQALLVVNGALAAYLVGRAFVGAGVAELRPYVVVLVVLVLAQAAFLCLDSLLAHIAAFRALADLRRRCYDAVERISPGHLSTQRSGDLGATVMDDIEILELFFAHTLGPLIAATVIPSLAVLLLLFLAWPAALVLLPFVVAVASIPRWLRRHADEVARAERANLGALNAELVDTVQGAREIAALGAGEEQLAALHHRGGLLRQAQLAHARRTGVERAAVDLLAALGVVAVLIVAGLLVDADRLGPALLPTCAVLAAGAFAPVALFTESAKELGRIAAGSARVHDLLNRPPLVSDEGDESVPTIPPRVRFADVSFRYEPGLPDALRAASFTIEPGETVALVGASGAGKSTCAALLLRLYDVGGGSVSIDGVDVRALPVSELRRLVSLVPQDVYLFSRSVRDNLTLARPDADDASVQAAADAAIVTEFVASMPDGFQTRVGERGVRLSGGQRQRLAVGRALVQDTPVLVFDEATSSLDAESEAAMRTAIAAATRGRTTLVIAHRLSTIRAADRLVVLDHGEVVETGTFDQLLTERGHFAALVAAGFGGPDR
ncbi:MAG: ABC transporter ATP-binding protein [Geodermatophilaceae bacterium]